jgi:carbonic anhydrase/acetyltransferase-like protein (isoleucine patch superfamily)
MPSRGKNVFIAPGAHVMGEVSLADDVSVWYNAVIRADVERLEVGPRTNIQDGAILHADYGQPTVIGSDVTLGHGAIVHGASIGEGSLVGMRATVLNRAKVGRFCIIGAHALVTEGMEIPDYSMVVGTPAKIIKQLPPESTEQMLRLSAAHYVEMAQQHAEEKFVTMR